MIGAPNQGLTREWFSSASFGRGSSTITIISNDLNNTVLQIWGMGTGFPSQQGGPAGVSLLVRGTYLGASLGAAVLRWNGWPSAWQCRH